VVVVPRRRDVDRALYEISPVNEPGVLLIDRQPLFLAALGSLLSAPPINGRIQLAYNTEVGLELVLAGGVQLVFCEVKAERMSPVELADRLSQLTPSVPLILLGEPDDEQVMASALDTSVAGMFTKDASLDEFLAGVKAVLSGHRAVGARLMSRVIGRLSENAMPLRRSASQLSPTELHILTLIGEAKSIPFIAESRGISNKTVRNHLANIYRKLELRSRTEAMLCAARMGLTSG
jgi:DNA-binding NarL/FixJ family response regulator